MKNNKGLSLIVLIITIIVVIILAAVVILTMSKNNPIESSKEARFKEDVRSFQDELTMYISSETVKDYNGIREKITTSNMPSTDEMKQYIASFSKKYENKLGIYNDELVYYIADEDENVTNKVTDQEEKWLKDLGIKERVIETSEEEFEWGSNDPNNPAYYTLVKYNGTGEKVTIPQRCKVIGERAFSGNQNLIKVKFQDGVTSIQNNAFASCFNLQSVILSNNLKSIGNQAFNYCFKLNNIEFTENIESIGSYSFSQCTSLDKIVIPEKVTVINKSTFSGCDNLKEVELPNTLTIIYGTSFNNCKQLKNIEIPENVCRIADRAFEREWNRKCLHSKKVYFSRIRGF